MSSYSNASSTGKRPPNEDDLCKAIVCLRKKMPKRSLEQIIIRLHQAVDFKMSTDGSSVYSDKKFDAKSVNSRVHDF